MSATNVTVRIPEAVWHDYLDPMASDMQADIGLPTPQRVKRGFGYSRIYEGITTTMADDLADYLVDRAVTLLGQDEEGDVHRAAIKAADRIRTIVAVERRRTGVA